MSTFEPDPQEPNGSNQSDGGPQPRSQKPGTLFAVIGGVALLGLLGLLVALIVLTSGDDGDIAAVGSSLVEETTTSSTVEEDTTTTSELETTTSSTEEGTTSTTVQATTTTEASTSSTTALSVPPAAGNSAWVVIKNSPDLSEFRQAVEEADLVKLFEDGKPITAFVPSNDAFAALRAGVGGAALLDDPEQLIALILHHVISGKMTIDQVFASSELATDNDDSLTVDGAAMTVGGATVLVSDVDADASVIHVIDQVLVP